MFDDFLGLRELDGDVSVLESFADFEAIGIGADFGTEVSFGGVVEVAGGHAVTFFDD